MAERALPTLDLSGSSSQVANNWKKWKRAFEYYAEGKGLGNTRKKTSQLLHYAGMEVQDIFVELEDPDPAGDEDPYAVCIKKLDHHFRSDENIPVPAVWRRRMANRSTNLGAIAEYPAQPADFDSTATVVRGPQSASNVQDVLIVELKCYRGAQSRSR